MTNSELVSKSLRTDPNGHVFCAICREHLCGETSDITINYKYRIFNKDQKERYFKLHNMEQRHPFEISILKHKYGIEDE